MRSKIRAESSHLAGPAKSTTDAAIQISWCRATIFLNPRRYPQHFQTSQRHLISRRNNATVPSGKLWTGWTL